ncbi:MAG TPA: response regulator [Gemmatimonadaceae bacterium]|nr:response regulator [Gemmatimonadaceae bacterium]
MNDSSKHCVLLVEDNVDDAQLALAALRGNRIVNEVVLARDGEEARDYLFGLGSHAGRDASHCPQLVLLDLKLPKIDGLDVLRRIRADERTRLTPVVVLTSSDEEEDLIRSYRLGANSYVRKPIDFERFLEAIRQLTVYWLVLNEAPKKEG